MRITYKPLKIGLLLGSFDPIHIGHMNIATCAINSKLCDKVLFVVAKQNPFKKEESTPFDIRCNMVFQAILDADVELKKYQICKLEGDIEPPTYSYKVLELIRKEYPCDDLFILCGSDTLNSMPYWKNYDTHIKPHFKNICVLRGEHKQPSNGKPFEVKEENGVIFITPIMLNVSSTLIRNMVKENMNPTPYVTDGVSNIIKRYNLYKDNDGREEGI